MDLLFHLYGEKHKGGGFGYEFVEGENAISVTC